MSNADHDTSVYILDGGLVVTADGEILDVPPGTDVIRLLAYRLEDARVQRKLYEQEEALLQQALLRQMARAGINSANVSSNDGAPDLVVRVRTSTYAVQHTDEFATQVQAMLPDITKDELCAIIHAAKSFAPEAVPDQFQEFLAAATEHRPKRPYVEVTRPRRPSRLQRLEQTSASLHEQ